MTTPSSRLELLAAVISPRRLTEADRETTALAAFCRRLGLAPTAEVVTLYLTWLLEHNSLSGSALRQRLQRLDLDAKRQGQPAWSSQPQVQRYLRGLHTVAPLATKPRADPLYPELLHAVIDATMSSTFDQLRAMALVLLANQTQLSARALAKLRWQDLHFHPGALTVQLPDPAPARRSPNNIFTVATTGSPSCTVSALWQLRRFTPAAQPLVFGSARGPWDHNRIGRELAALQRSPRRRLNATQLGQLLDRQSRPHPQQLRDRCLLLLGSAVALHTYEAVGLRQGDFIFSRGRLHLRLITRRGWFSLALSTPPAYCVLSAWRSWQHELRRQGHDDPLAPAFPQVSGAKIWGLPMSTARLNLIIQHRCGQAQLTGRYTFTSLRSGHIRSAIRDGTPTHTVAASAGLTALHSVARHQEREFVPHQNIAARLGL